MLRFVLAALIVASALRAETVAQINAATLYTPVFSNITAWRQANRDFQFSTTNVSSPQADVAFSELRPQLDALVAARNANYCDWGVKYEEGFAATLPHIGPLRDANRAALWASDYATAKGDPALASQFATEAMRVGRNGGEDLLLISLLVQIAAEKPALERLTKLAANLSAGELDQLAGNLSAMPPGATVLEAMEMEKAMAVDTLLQDLMDIIREADSNVVFASELGMRDATNTADLVSSRSANGASQSWLAENLRLTSIVDLGGRFKLGFETKDADSFVLAIGRPQRGIELVSADFVREEAIITRSNETALVKLKSREITKIDLNLRLPDPEKLEAIATKVGKGKYKAIAALLANFKQAEGSEQALTRDIALGGADGMVRLLRTMSDDYSKWIEAYKTMPREKFKEWQKTYIDQVSPMTKLLLPATDKCIDKEQELLAARDALSAAISARRAQLGGR